MVGTTCSPGTAVCPVDPDHPIDTSAPAWSSSYPKVSLIQPRQINIDIIQSESGFFYWVVLEDGATAPTSAQVKARTAPDGAPVSSGFQAVNALTLATGLNMGLSSSTTYNIYIVCEDTIPNLQTEPTLVVASTPSDTMPPAWMVGFPRIVTVTDTSIGFESRVNEDGTVYYALAPEGTPTPTSAEIKAGTVSGAVDQGSDPITKGGITVSSLITGVASFQTYKLWVVAGDGDGNLQATPATLTVVTDPPPAFNSGFPRMVPGTVLSIQATMEVNINEAGTVHWCLMPAVFHQPSPSDIQAGTCSGKVNAGHITVASADTTESYTFTGLEPSTTYFVMMANEDLGSNLNFATTSVSFKTGGVDTSPPGNVQGFPALTIVRDTWIEMTSQLTEPGVVYMAITLASSGFTPSPAQVKAGTHADFVTFDNRAVARASNPVVIVETGLVEETDYEAWIVADDVVGNLQTIVNKKPFTTTPDQTAPAFDSGYPHLANVLETTADVVIRLREAGDVWYLIVPTGSSAPTAQDIVDGAGAIATGTANVNAYVEQVLPATGLRGSRTYDLYFTTEDSLTNRMDPPLKQTFTTAPDVTAPSFVVSFPQLEEVQDKAVAINSKLNEDGFTYVIVQAAGDAAPSAATVKAGTGVGSSASAAVTEDTATTLIVWGLTPNTAYKAYLLGEDQSGNQVAALAVLDFTTGTVDTFFPRFLPPTPRITDITDTTANIEVELTEAVTIYWVLVPSSASASSPTCSLVQSGTVTDSVASGNGAVASAGLEMTIPIASGISLGNSYTVYVCGRDGPGNMHPTPHSLFFTAAATDLTAPNFSAGYPQLTSITDTSVTVVTQLDEPGNFYFVVLARDFAAPTSAAVKAGTGALSAGGAGVTQAATSSAATGHGLALKTEYDVWVVSEDTQQNLQGAPTKLQFETSEEDLTPPKFPGGFPNVDQITDSTCRVNVQLDEAGKVFYVILPKDATKPTTLQVKSAAGAAAAGEISVTSGGTSFTDVAVDLVIDTEYTLWAVAQDLLGNLQAVASDGKVFTTANVDTTAPTWLTGFPKLHIVTDTSVSAKVKPSEPCTIYAMVVADGAAAPTSTAVKAGSAGLGSGSLIIVTGRIEQVVTVPAGLTAETAYDLYLVAEDGTGNLQSAPTPVDFTTTQDQTAPGFVGAPTATNVAHNAVTLELQLNEPGTAYYCIVANGAGTNLTSAMVRSRNCGDTEVADGTLNVVAASTAYASRATSPFMRELSDYDILVVAEDDLGNLQAAPTVVTYQTTQDTEAPTSAVTISGSSQAVVLDITVSEPCTAYYIIVAAIPAGDPLPTSGNVVAGVGPSASVAIAAGSEVINAASLTGQVTIPATNFPENTQFDVFVVAIDEATAANKQSPPSRDTLTELLDRSPPGFMAGYPLIIGVSDLSFSVEAGLSEPGIMYVVVLPLDDPAPTSAEVKAGKGAGGANPVADTSAVIATPNQPVSALIAAGLTSGAAYDVYVTAEDAAVTRRLGASAHAGRRLGNLMANPFKLNVIMELGGAGQLTAGQETNDDIIGGGAGVGGAMFGVILAIALVLLGLCVCACIVYYKRKQRKAKYHPVEPVVLPARSRSGSFSTHSSRGSRLSERSMGFADGPQVKRSGARRGSGRSGMSLDMDSPRRPRTGDSYTGPGSVNSDLDDDYLGGGDMNDVVDLEADLQAAENVAQRAMNRPQEDLGEGEDGGFNADLMKIVDEEEVVASGPAVKRSGAGRVVGSETVITTTTTTVTSGLNPLDRAPLPNALASPLMERHSGAPRRASLLAPLPGVSSMMDDGEDHMLMSDIVAGIHHVEEIKAGAPPGEAVPAAAAAAAAEEA